MYGRDCPLGIKRTNANRIECAFNKRTHFHKYTHTHTHTSFRGAFQNFESFFFPCLPGSAHLNVSVFSRQSFPSGFKMLSRVAWSNMLFVAPSDLLPPRVRRQNGKIVIFLHVLVCIVCMCVCLFGVWGGRGLGLGLSSTGPVRIPSACAAEPAFRRHGQGGCVRAHQWAARAAVDPHHQERDPAGP